MENSESEYITIHDSILLLIDYQPNMINSVESGDKHQIKNAAIASAKTACILNIPVIYASLDTKDNGEFIKELVSIFPHKEVLTRNIPHFDAFENELIVRVLRNSNRKKIIVSGLWTSASFAYTAIHGIHKGYSVYGLIDACGDASQDAHNYGIQRMLKAGIAPLTSKLLISDWLNDWANPGRKMAKDAYLKYHTMFSF